MAKNDEQEKMDARSLHKYRVQLAQNIIAGAVPTQKDWFQVGEGAGLAWGAQDKELLTRAYWIASKRLGIVGACEA